MAAGLLPPVSAEVWGLPISETLVGLYAVFPKTVEDVTIRVERPAAKLWKRRRVIGARHRIHLFLFRLDDVRELGECTLSYREGGVPVPGAVVQPRLPDRRLLGTVAALRAIVAALEEDGYEAAPALAHTLAALSSWSVPCRYHAAEGGVSLAVFSFTPSALGAIPVLSVEREGIRERRLVVVEHDPESCCLLWRDETMARAYAEADGEILELCPEAPWTMRTVPLAAWFAGLAADQQDRVLDGFSQVAETGDWPFLRQLPARRTVGVGTVSAHVEGVFRLGDRVLLCARTAEAGRPDRVELDPGSGGPVEMRESSLTAPSVMGQWYEAELPAAHAEGSAARVSMTFGAAAQSTWVRAQSLRDGAARRDFHRRVAWETADQALVEAYAEAIIDAGTAPAGPPAIIALYGARGKGALVVTEFQGDETALQATLLAIGIGLPDATVRLVHRGPLAASRQAELRDIFRTFGVHGEMVVASAHAPIGEALAIRGSDVARPAVIFCQCGTTPVQAGWSGQIDQALQHHPTAIHWGSPSGDGEPGLAIDALSHGVPLLAVGPEVDPSLLTFPFDVHTLAGFILHVQTAARRVGRLRRLHDLRLVRFAPFPVEAHVLGDLRIDDALNAGVAAAFGRTEAAPGAEGRLVVVQPPLRQRVAS
ncbi:MAG: hypothetical protein J0H08_10515 [Rhizobiales bacterium]|nr:hypothetical protein [Hyphomicrobiales bacterium]